MTSSPPPWERVAAQPSPQLASPPPSSAGLSTRIESNANALRNRLASLSGQIGALRDQFGPAAQHESDHAREQSAAEAATAERAYRTRESALTQRRDAESTRLNARISEVLAEIAPGSAVADLNVALAEGTQLEATPSRFQRVGAVRFGDSARPETALPFVSPLTVGSGWHLAGDTAQSADLLLNTLGRLVLQGHLSRLRIHVFDPRSSGALARFAGMRTVNAASFPQPHASATGFLARIQDALSQAPLNAERTAIAGARDFFGLWQTDPSTEAPLSVFVVLDYPYSVSVEMSAALQQLASLGPASGTLLLVHENSALPAADRVDATALTALLPRLESAGGRVRTPQSGALVISADAPLTTQSVESIIDSARRRLAANVGRTINLEDLLGADLQNPWSRSSIHEIETILGVAGNDAIPVSFRTENPPHSNVLLGGMVGTGKSNALKDIIFSAAVRYAPSELEFVLLDFKAGIEFKSFDADASGTGWLPHVSVLGLESDQEYGIAVLQSVAAEIDRRSRLFRDAGGASSIVRYRETTGEVLPRLVLVIDEFHVILDGDEDLASDAADLLELIAKQGRAFGVHLLLASQALTGIRGLRTKADAIFSQFPVRLSLKNSPSESQAFLSQGNRAAADLAFRGEVIVNRNLGQAPETDNLRGLAAYVDSERFAAIQRDLWSRDRTRRPRVFLGSSFADWSNERWRALPRGVNGEQFDLWIGRPVAVDDAPATVRLRPDADQLVAIIGGDQGRDRVAPAALSSMIASAAAQLPRGSEFVILDASGDDTAARLQRALDLARGEGHRVITIDERSVAGYLRDTLSARIDQRGGQPVQIVIALGVQRIPGIDDAGIPDPSASTGGGFSFGATTTSTARDAIANAGRRGALAGVHVIASWSNLSSMEQTMGLAHNGVLAYVTVASGAEDLKRIAGPLTKRLSGHPRVGLHDRRSDSPLRPIVPFDPAFVSATTSENGADAS